MTTAAEGPLGRQATVPRQYCPEVLHAIDRAAQRKTSLPYGSVVALDGEEVWHCYEFGWLRDNGLMSIGELVLNYSADSPCIVESKSLKLYLNGLTHTAFDDVEHATETIRRDLSKTLGVEPNVRALGRGDIDLGLASFPGVNLESHVNFSALRHADTFSRRHSSPRPDVLSVQSSDSVAETVHTHLFQCVCPITAQPDLATVVVDYEGQQLDRESLLAYLSTYRDFPIFHEVAIDRVFSDLAAELNPKRLTVVAHFLRRGGISINVIRTVQTSSSPVEDLTRRVHTEHLQQRQSETQ